MDKFASDVEARVMEKLAVIKINLGTPTAVMPGKNWIQQLLSDISTRLGRPSANMSAVQLADDLAAGLPYKNPLAKMMAQFRRPR